MQMFDWDGKLTPRLGFGCGSVMGRVGRGESLRAMHEAWESGISLFDTARSYGYGEAEGLLGEFLVGRREQAIVVTKFGIMPQQTSRWKRFAKPLVRAALRVAPSARGAVRRSVARDSLGGQFDVRTLRASLEESLRQLRTDCVDALLAHEAPASAMAQDDLMAELGAVVREGKARRAGTSTTGRDAALVAMRGPSVLSVLQYPAWGISDWPVGLVEERLRMANHPLGGPALVRGVAKGFAGMAKDAQVSAALRAKLQGDSMERVAEFWFARTMQQSRPHVIVPSMLRLDHLRANVVAMESTRFDADDVAEITRWITMLKLIP